jgi:hypothetical protein
MGFQNALNFLGVEEAEESPLKQKLSGKYLQHDSR